MKNAASPYREVRALERGLLLMETLGTVGWATPAVLAERTGIERPTVYRLLNTLAHMDYVIRRPEDGTFFLTPKVQRVGSHIRQVDVDIQTVMPHLESLVERIFWPSDFATLISGHVTIQASNHSQTTMSIFRGLIGLHRPLLRSALGRAILAAMSTEELEHTIEVVRASDSPDAQEFEDKKKVQQVIDETLARGYATSAGLVHPKFSAMALPVRQQRRVVGAVNLLYFRSAMTADEAASRYIAPLKACVEAIEQSLPQSGAGSC